jgi:hypothetical protein
MLRHEAIGKYNLYYDETRRCHGYEDWELHIRLAETRKPILFCPAPLYQYRIRDDSLLTEARKSYLEIINYIRGNIRTSMFLNGSSLLSAPMLLL